MEEEVDDVDEVGKGGMDEVELIGEGYGLYFDESCNWCCKEDDNDDKDADIGCGCWDDDDADEVGGGWRGGNWDDKKWGGGEEIEVVWWWCGWGCDGGGGEEIKDLEEYKGVDALECGKFTLSRSWSLFILLRL